MEAPSHVQAVLNDIQAGRLSPTQLAGLLAAVACHLALSSAATSKPMPLTPPTVAGQKLALNRQEAAKALSMAVRTLDDLTSRGLIKPSRGTGRPLYSLTELQRYLEETQSDEPADERRRAC